MSVQSSDRVPLSQAGILCAVLVLCWVAVSSAGMPLSNTIRDLKESVMECYQCVH